MSYCDQCEEVKDVREGAATQADTQIGSALWWRAWSRVRTPVEAQVWPQVRDIVTARADEDLL